MKGIGLLLGLLITAGVWAQEPDSAFVEANRLYQEKEYEEALNLYQGILDEGFESSALYYNMGNCYFKSKQLAEAILYYERALKLSPYDDDTRQNLEIVRKGTIDRFEEVPKPLVRTAYLSLMQALSPGAWAIAAVITMFILLGGVASYFFTSFRRPGFTIAAVSLVVGVLCISMAYAHRSFLEKNRPAIVMATSSYVKSGPGEKAEDVFILHEGTYAVVTEDYEGWKKIKLPDGKVGWINSSDVTEI